MLLPLGEGVSKGFLPLLYVVGDGVLFPKGLIYDDCCCFGEGAVRTVLGDSKGFTP
jgi:hypothetical protein